MKHRITVGSEPTTGCYGVQSGERATCTCGWRGTLFAGKRGPGLLNVEAIAHAKLHLAEGVAA